MSEPISTVKAPTKARSSSSFFSGGAAPLRWQRYRVRSGRIYVYR